MAPREGSHIPVHSAAHDEDIDALVFAVVFAFVAIASLFGGMLVAIG